MSESTISDAVDTDAVDTDEVETKERVNVSYAQKGQAFKLACKNVGGRPNKYQLHEAWVEMGLCSGEYDPNSVKQTHDTFAKKMAERGIDVALQNLSRGRQGFAECTEELDAMFADFNID